MNLGLIAIASANLIVVLVFAYMAALLTQKISQKKALQILLFISILLVFGSGYALQIAEESFFNESL